MHRRRGVGGIALGVAIALYGVIDIEHTLLLGPFAALYIVLRELPALRRRWRRTGCACWPSPCSSPWADGILRPARRGRAGPDRHHRPLWRGRHRRCAVCRATRASRWVRCWPPRPTASASPTVRPTCPTSSSASSAPIPGIWALHAALALLGLARLRRSRRRRRRRFLLLLVVRLGGAGLAAGQSVRSTSPSSARSPASAA